MNSVQNLLRSAGGTAFDDAKERQSFRFPFRGKAHKPSLQFVLEYQPRRVSSLTWSNPWQGFSPDPPLSNFVLRSTKQTDEEMI